MEKVIHDFATEIKLTNEEAQEICKLRKGEECCAFLVIDPHGFKCIRMSYPLNLSIFTRLEEGTMNAKGRGRWEGCPWKEEVIR